MQSEHKTPKPPEKQNKEADLERALKLAAEVFPKIKDLCPEAVTLFYTCLTKSTEALAKTTV